MLALGWIVKMKCSLSSRQLAFHVISLFLDLARFGWVTLAILISQPTIFPPSRLREKAYNLAECAGQALGGSEWLWVALNYIYTQKGHAILIRKHKCTNYVPIRNIILYVSSQLGSNCALSCFTRALSCFTHGQNCLIWKELYFNCTLMRRKTEIDLET